MSDKKLKEKGASSRQDVKKAPALPTTTSNVSASDRWKNDRGKMGGADANRRPSQPKALPGLAGFSPYAPVIRPGHYDHIEESLIPSSVDKDALPRHPLEKSSSSFLKGVATPPSTASEEEVGVLGINMLCITKKKHYVDNKLRNEETAKHFGDVMIVIIIFINVPCLLLQLLYVVYHEFRFQLLLHYNICCGLFFLFVALSIAMKYFTGLARRQPYHLILVVMKSLLWAWTYTLLASLVECIYIRQMAVEHVNNHNDNNRNTTKKEDEIDAEVYEVYKQFVTKTFTEEDLVSEEEDEENLKAENLFFFAGIIYAICLMILMRILSKCVKLNFFGPIFPFISYTLTLFVILAATIYFLISKNSNSDDDDKLWMLIHATCGPLIGVIITELFVIYLQALLRGKLCPLKKDEYLYASAHY